MCVTYRSQNMYPDMCLDFLLIFLYFLPYLLTVFRLFWVCLSSLSKSLFVVSLYLFLSLGFSPLFLFLFLGNCVCPPGILGVGCWSQTEASTLSLLASIVISWAYTVYYLGVDMLGVCCSSFSLCCKCTGCEMVCALMSRCIGGRWWCCVCWHMYGLVIVLVRGLYWCIGDALYYVWGMIVIV